MRAFVKQQALPFLASLAGLERLIAGTKEPLINVFYHTVSDVYLPHIAPLYRPRNTKEFERDLDFLLQHFQPVDAHEVLLHVRNEKRIEKPSFHLSFDDGLREVYEIAMPVLLRKGVHATVFVNSGFVDNRDLFFRYKAALIAGIYPEIEEEVLNINYTERNCLDGRAQESGIYFNDFLQKQQPYLTSGQLKAWKKNGFTIGAHSEDHPQYALIPEAEQVAQTLNSCDFVQKEFAETERYFAFPFSAAGVSDCFFEKIRNSVDLTFGISGIHTAHGGRYTDRIDMETYGKNAEKCIQRAYMTRFLKQIRL